MAIQRTALDLRQARFRAAFGGADPAEVEGLLELAADAYEAAYTELDVLRRRHDEASRQLKSMHEGERALSRVVIQAEEAAGAIRKAAGEQVRRLLLDAEMRALAITEPVEAAREAIEREIEEMERRRGRAASALGDAIGELEGRAPDREPAAEDALEVAPVAGPAGDGVPAHAGGLIGGSAAAEDEESAAPAEPEPGVNDGNSAETPDEATRPRVAPGRSTPEVHLPAAAPTDFVAWAPAPVVPSHSGSLQALEPCELSDADTGREGWWTDQSADTGPDGENGEPPASSSSRGRWVVAGAAAAVLVIGAAVGLPHLTRLFGTPAVGASIAGERMDAPAVLAASALPTGDASARPSRAAAVPAASAAPLRARLTAARECWVRITVDGRAEERILASGEVLVREASDEIAVRVGDAGALTVELNGELLPPLGRDGHVVNRVFRSSEY